MATKASRTRGLRGKPKARFEIMPPPYLKGRKCYMDTKDTDTGKVQARIVARIMCDSWERDWGHVAKPAKTKGLRGKPKGGYQLMPPPYLKRGKCYMDHKNVDTGKVEARIIGRMLCDMKWPKGGTKRKAAKKKKAAKRKRS